MKSMTGAVLVALALFFTAGACSEGWEPPYPAAAEANGPAAEGITGGDSVAAEPSGTLVKLPSPVVSRRLLAPWERAAIADRRPAATPAVTARRVLGPRLPEDRDREITARTLKRLAILPSHARVTLTVELSDPGYDFTQLRRKDDTERLGLISARMGQIARHQDETTFALGRLGATVAGRFWLGGSGLAVEAAAGSAPAIAALPGVRFVELDEGEDRPTTSYDLRSIRNGSRVQHLLNAGYDSNTNNRADATRPMRIGIIESDGSGTDNYVGRTHVGYCDNDGSCTSRVKRVYMCTSSCATTSAVMDPEMPHGQIVSSIAAGSIHQGQDPNFPGSDTTDQRRRSGMAPEADIYYYLYDGGGGLRNAIQKAVEDGADIVNMSFGFGSSGCNPDEDHDSVNAVLRDATDADVLFVGATGNDKDATLMSDPCRLLWPGTRPEVLTTVGLYSVDSTMPYGDLSIRYPIGPFQGCASRFGGMPIVMRDGSAQTATVLSLAAPGLMRLMYRDPPNSYDETDFGGCGSSFAAPVVAGAAAGLRDVFRTIGWGAANDARAMYVNMALLGDGWNGQNVTTPGGSVRTTTDTNRRSGFGRVVMRWPEAGGVAGPWYWHWAPHTVHTDEEISVTVNTSAAEPSGITEFKVVAVWFPTSFDSVSDVILEVINNCSGEVLLYTDDTWDYHKRVRVSGSVAAGKCLVSRLVGVDTPSAGQKVYLAHMYHAGAI
jgi:hypothetical protein